MMMMMMDGLACYCCCTVLAFFFSFFFFFLYSVLSSGRARGSCLISTLLLLLHTIPSLSVIFHVSHFPHPQPPSASCPVSLWFLKGSCHLGIQCKSICYAAQLSMTPCLPLTFIQYVLKVLVHGRSMLGWAFSGYSWISGFTCLSESIRNGFGMCVNFECEFLPFRLRTLTWSHSWICSNSISPPKSFFVCAFSVQIHVPQEVFTEIYISLSGRQCKPGEWERQVGR